MIDKKTISSSNVSETAFRSMLRVYGLLKRAMEPYFAKFGISGSQWGVLRILYRAKTDGLPDLLLRDIGERLLIRPPSVTSIVNRLERLGLVTIKVSSKDFRAKQINLSPAGCELVERILEKHGIVIDDIFSELSVDEQNQLHELMERIGHHLDEIVNNQKETILPI